MHGTYLVFGRKARALVAFAAVSSALSVACGSDFSGAGIGGTSGSMALGGSSGVGGGTNGAGGSSIGTGGNVVVDEGGSEPPEAGVITADAKPVIPDAASDYNAVADAAGRACKEPNDCSGGLTCLFDIQKGCAVEGVCIKVEPPGAICNGISYACSCSGQTVNVICNGFPGGYYPERIAHSGPC